MLERLNGSGRRVAIIQPSYLPWRGFFHMLWLSDVCIFLDDVQYDKDSWRNRNRLKGPNGPFWITVPVRIPRWPPPAVCAIEIDNSRDWMKKHRRSLRTCYAGSSHAKEFLPPLEEFLSRPWRNLAELDIHTSVALARLLGFELNWRRATDLGVAGAPLKPSERLVRLCRAVGATHYLSGPTARAYVEEDRFADAGIRFEYMQYEYPEYPQLFAGFEPHVSVVDLLLNCGREAGDFIWGDLARSYRERAVRVVSAAP